MKKQIKLTESNLRLMVENAVRNVLKEYSATGNGWADSVEDANERDWNEAEFKEQHNGNFEDFKTGINAEDGQKIVEYLTGYVGIPQQYIDSITINFYSNCEVKNGKVMRIEPYPNTIEYYIQSEGNAKAQIEQKLRGHEKPIAYCIAQSFDPSNKATSYIQEDFEDQFPDAKMDGSYLDYV